MGLLFKNNAETTLSSGINDAVTTVPVTSAAVFPTPDANNVFFATLDDGTNVETVKVTGISSNDLTVVRAQDNTSAAAFGSGAKIELRLNAKVLDMGTSSLTDLDGDTKIQVEESADEDKIRFDTGGSERAVIDSSGLTVGDITVNGSTISEGGTGALILRSNNTVVQNAGGTENIATFTEDAAASLYYDNNKKFETVSGGIKVTGNIENASGDLTLDVAGTIILDSSQNVNLYANGTHFAYLQNENSDFRIGPIIQDKDFIVRGNDGGTYVDGLKIDFSDAGRAICNGGIDIAANTDIELNDGNWTGEKTNKIQAHANNLYLQYNTSGGLFFRNSGGNDRASLDSSGNFTTEGNVTAYGSVSDKRLKENIEVIENPIEKIKDLKGVTFNYKKDGSKSTGLIAQDLQKVLPEAVYTSKTIADETKGEKPEEHLAIHYGNTVGLLVEAIKELEARIKELENK